MASKFMNPKPATAPVVPGNVADLESGNYSGPSSVEVKTPPLGPSAPSRAPEAPSSWRRFGLGGTVRRKKRKTRKGQKRIRKTHKRRH